MADAAALVPLTEFLSRGHVPEPLGSAVLGWVCGVISGLGPATVRLTSSQVAFRRRVGFAWLWVPSTWLHGPAADLVLSVGLRQPLPSPRWKQVVQPYPGRWMHHLEVRSADELDPQVAGWMEQAYAGAG